MSVRACVFKDINMIFDIGPRPTRSIYCIMYEIGKIHGKAMGPDGIPVDVWKSL